MKTVKDFILGGSKVMADGDCSREIKRCLLLGRKDSILKSRDIINKGPSSQGYSFSNSHVWMWELGYKESWALKNWCCWTVILEKTLESPLYCKEIQPVNPKGNQFWIFTGRTDAEAEAQYFSHLMWRTDSFKKTLILGKIEGRKKRGQQKMRLLDCIMDLMDMSYSKIWGLVMNREPGVLKLMGSQRVRHDWVTELNWTEPYLLKSKPLAWLQGYILPQQRGQ